MSAGGPVEVLRVGADADLSPLTNLLWRERVPHRVVEGDGVQCLLVPDLATARRVQALARTLQDGAAPSRVGTAAPPVRADGAVRALRAAPFTGCVLLAAVLLAPLGLWAPPTAWPALDRLFDAALEALFFAPSTLRISGWQAAGWWFAAGEPWRLITPVLLHFSLPHLLLDAALFWAFGRRIEAGAGARATAWLVLGVGVGSNLAQCVLGGGTAFGGLSGVVAGQVGYVLAVQRTRPALAERLAVPQPLLLAVLLSMVLLATGITEVFGLHIANAAHWSGLALGALVGALGAAGGGPADGGGAAPDGAGRAR